MSENRTLNAKINISVNPQDAARAEKAGSAIEEKLKGAQQQADKLKSSLEKVAQTGEKLQQVGASIGAIGAAITGPLLLAAKSYVDAVGRADTVSAAWLDSNERISKATQRIGRVVASEALPFLEKAASLAEKAAQFAEQNPEAIGAALKIGTVLTGLGAALITAGQVAKTAASVGMLYNNLAPALSSAGASLGGILAKAAPLLGVVGSVGGGLALGGAGYEALAKTQVGQSLGMESGTAGKALSLVAYGLGSLVGKGDEAFTAVAKWTGQLEDTKQASDTMTTALSNGESAFDSIRQTFVASVEEMKESVIDPETWQRAVEMYADYEQQQTDLVTQYGEMRANAQENYERQRTDIVTNYLKNEQKTARDYNSDRAKAAADFARSLANEDAKYYEDRAKRARDFSVQSQRAEQDHQRAMRRMQEDYLGGVADAETARDAAALYALTKDYEKNRQRAEEDRATEAERNNEDYAVQMQDLEAAHAAQRDERIRDFEEQQQEQAQQYEQEKQERYTAYQEQLADLDQSNSDQLTRLDAQLLAEQSRRDQDFKDRLAQLDASLDTESELRKKRMAEMEKELRAYLGQSSVSTAKSSGGSSGGGKAKAMWGGGYAGAGLYQLGEMRREFVMNGASTAAAERSLGGALSQERLMAAIGRGGSNANITIAPTFSNVGAQDQGWITAKLNDLARQINGLPVMIAEAMG